MSNVGRNEPCPCGSGRKYKRCCLGKGAVGDDLERAERLHALDGRLVVAILDWAQTAEPDALEWALGMRALDEPGDDLYAGIGVSALATVTGQGELTLAKRFLASQESRLLDHEIAWLRALLAAWLGLWEVLEVHPGRGLRVRDLMTDESRTVLDVMLAETVRRRQVICARVVDLEGLSLLVCVHPQSMRPSQAEAVIEQYLLEEDGPLPHSPDLLRGENANELLRFWHDACLEFSQPVLPRLQNRDGDVLQDTTDTLSFEPAARDEIVALLAAGDDVDVNEADDGDTHVCFVRPGDQTLLGAAHVGAEQLKLETVSEARADALLERVRGTLGARVELVGRDRRDMQDFMASRMGRRAEKSPGPSAGLQGPEIDALVRAYKTEHYATWPDTPLPMLGGVTPREGMKDTTLGRLVVATLKDIEAQESTLPEGQRYDVDILREALGMGPET